MAFGEDGCCRSLDLHDCLLCLGRGQLCGMKLVPIVIEIGRLLEVYEFVVTGIPKVLVQPDPLSGVEEGLRRQCPAHQIEQFLFVSIAFQHDVVIAADTLNFGKSCFQFEDSQVVQGGEGDDKIKLPISERIYVLSAVSDQRSVKVWVLLG